MAGKIPNAQQIAAQRARRKVKKVVTEGIAHVHASFNNTIITITDRQGNALQLPAPALRVSKALVSPLRSQLRLLPSRPAVTPLNMA